eukprot:TRINITY_DN19219_c0_g3_i1.p1 TRINITY_DN19219_c0_g3~~TRINITY_DN19219_c0_g3_i1.p1  ORF type:complete len:579 (+),score=267.93 TRINITY_DN19219_c0_g3_i1:94-1830(+)
MIDEFTVMHKGGLVLFKEKFQQVSGNPVNQVIKKVLIEDRAGKGGFQQDAYKVEWLLDNERDLIYVIVYKHLLSLGYISELLEAARDSFLSQFGGDLNSRTFLKNPTAFSETVKGYTTEFRKLVRDVEAATDALRKEARKSERVASPSRTAVKEEQKGEEAGPVEDEPSPTPSSPEQLTGRAALLEKMRKKKDQQSNIGGKAKPKPAKKPAPKKEMRQAGFLRDNGGTSTASYTPSAEDKDRVIEQTHDPTTDRTDVDGWSAEEKTEKPRSRFTTFLRERFGNRSIDVQDLDEILPALRDTMTSKNVAQEIAEGLISSARAELTGKSIPNLTSLSQCIKESLTHSLMRILTPKKDVNILRDVAKAKEQGRPYTIAFCGVNGVGKSTNLSKIAYWLRGNNQSVLIAACDTFRSGAVEQLKVHSGRIGVPVFDKGYAKDAADVAQSAIVRAKKDNTDVVLIDTAGRMQDNEPLMRSLAKLIHINKPDLVLFVGEALVGNDGVDQLRKFNSSLENFTPPGLAPRGIDGIILTKFDTIDDKVGAAISMVYESGQPIVFVGVGQSYQDLRTLNPQVVVSSLLN